MASNSITSAQVGTAVVAAAGAFKGLAVTLPIAANADTKTPLTLMDSTAAAGGGPVVFSASISDLLATMFATKTASVPTTPSSPTPPAAGTVFLNGSIPFASGLYVKSCPVNATFTATT